MSTWNDRIRNLSPEQRQLLDALLNKGAEVPARSGRSYVAPRSRVEEQLASIWSDVLGVSRIGIHDNFFDLGGDSIQSIRIVAKAREAGLALTTALLFAHPTIAGLAESAGASAEVEAQQEAVTGPVLLSPIQQWFFDLDLPHPEYWNQAMLFEVAAEVPDEAIRCACDAIVAHHDALRLGFERINGRRIQTCHPVGPAGFTSVTAVDEEEAQRAISAAHSGFDLRQGQLFRAVLLRRPSGLRQLLVAANHLSVDGLSFRIIAEDLQRACECVAHGEPVRLPLKTTSIQSWAERWTALADSVAVRAQTDYWLSAPANTPRLPTDGEGPNPESTAATVTSELDSELTVQLLRLAPSQFRAQFMELLLAAVALRIALWSEESAVWIDCESHGRADLPGVDLSRTVGWFTALFPLAFSPGNSFATSLDEVRRVFQGLPQRGMGFGLLRYSSTDGELRQRLAALPPRKILFNYLGHFDDSARAIPWFRYVPKLATGAYGPANPRPHILQIHGGILDGRLRLHWTYSSNLHRRETIQRLAGGVTDTLRAAAGVPAVLTPAQFPEAGLTAEDLRHILAAHS